MTVQSLLLVRPMFFDVYLRDVLFRLYIPCCLSSITPDGASVAFIIPGTAHCGQVPMTGLSIKWIKKLYCKAFVYRRILEYDVLLRTPLIISGSAPTPVCSSILRMVIC